MSRLTPLRDTVAVSGQGGYAWDFRPREWRLAPVRAKLENAYDGVGKLNFSEMNDAITDMVKSGG